MNQEKTILIVDDTDTNIHTLIELLDDRYDVLASLDGEGALELLEEEKVDLILLDIVMEGMDGFEVCKKLKENKKTSKIPVIFITSKTDEDSIEKAYEVGGVDYITKPFKAREIISRIKNHLVLSENTHVLEDNLASQMNFLNQYKQVVDESTIVSKTDKKGKITYVNKAFCDISGYSKDELVGKSHNMVRHPDMSKSAFKELWITINNKKVWHGEIKNRKKDGGYYYTQSTVTPILDDKGEIEEFISVRHDVTALYDLKQEIEDTQKEVVFTMGAIGERRSKETGYHVKRVAEYSRILAKYAGLDIEKIEMLVEASPMHDIGKIAISDNVLLKPGRLTDEEFDIMKNHALLGYEMLSHSTRPLLKIAATVALEHHEKWDGTGYPYYLKGEEISIEGRITAIADVFDALASDRVYKKAWSDEHILEFFQEQKGKHFDPHLTDIFFEHLDEFFKIREEFSDNI